MLDFSNHSFWHGGLSFACGRDCLQEGSDNFKELNNGATSQVLAVFVLGVGEPARTSSPVGRMTERSGKKVDITITGFQKNEKLPKELLSKDEAKGASEQDLILYGEPPTVNTAKLEDSGRLLAALDPPDSSRKKRKFIPVNHLATLA